MILALSLLDPARAQTCSCSVGTSDTTLPTGNVPPKGSIHLGLDYGVGETGGAFDGLVPAVDRLGNSMADMAMPGHRAQSMRASASVGLPEGCAATAAAPFVYSVPLSASDMPGDVPRAFVGDVSLGGRWGHRRGDTFLGAGVGVTLPTGKVVRGLGVRGGRGAVGAVLDVDALQMVAPVVGLGARLAWTQGVTAPVDDYTVGPQLDATLGSRIWIHEQGRVSVLVLGSFLHKGHDRRGDDALEQTGVDGLLAGAGSEWRFWTDEQRSASLSLHGQVPIYQVVGDPWLSESWTVSAGVAFGF